MATVMASSKDFLAEVDNLTADEFRRFFEMWSSFLVLTPKAQKEFVSLRGLSIWKYAHNEK
jgi:hypothetical protein